MRWLALCDGDGPFALGSVQPKAGGLIDCGSMVAEFTLSARAGVTRLLIDFQREAGWPRQIQVAQTEEGSLTLMHRQADSIASAAVMLALPPEPTLLRLT